MKEEKELQEEFKILEKTERECFSALSNAVRDSHEKERAQAEKTKYWSVLGSILGTCIGIFGTTINNRMRMNELRRLVSQNNAVEEIKEIGDNLTADFSSHRSSLAGLVTAVESVVNKADSSVGNLEKMEELCEVVRGASEKISVRTLDASLETLRKQQETLNLAISEHREQVDSRVGEILTDIFDQKRQMQEINSLAVKDREMDHKQMDKREADFRATSDSLNHKSTELKETIMDTVKVIDDKIKDVHSLLLHHQDEPLYLIRPKFQVLVLQYLLQDDQEHPPGTADRTYIEPLEWRIVEKIIAKEKPDALLPTLGGQTALNLAMDLSDHGILDKYGVEMIGADADVIDKAENRDRFQQAMNNIGLDICIGETVTTVEQARVVMEKVGLPCLIRPSFTMGGSGSAIAYNKDEFDLLVQNL